MLYARAALPTRETSTSCLPDSDSQRCSVGSPKVRAAPLGGARRAAARRMFGKIPVQVGLPCPAGVRRNARAAQIGAILGTEMACPSCSSPTQLTTCGDWRRPRAVHARSGRGAMLEEGRRHMPTCWTDGAAREPATVPDVTELEASYFRVVNWKREN
ncbi:hypothetical protein PVAP13_4KG133400 [Panicum virgatum]|uniref:Uncharacterized protein n=1 Tax=Panicum virgatum TaxID=38727 RepID=A0A8T0TQX7_PANVG|nr:hypothetical protein PVAP13_4KG133400 [Panicum virgatum]